jgi:hypothetical protein
MRLLQRPRQVDSDSSETRNRHVRAGAVRIVFQVTVTQIVRFLLERGLRFRNLVFLR